MLTLRLRVKCIQEGVVESDRYHSCRSGPLWLAPSLAQNIDVVATLSLIGQRLDHPVGDGNAVDGLHKQSVLRIGRADNGGIRSCRIGYFAEPGDVEVDMQSTPHAIAQSSLRLDSKPTFRPFSQLIRPNRHILVPR